MTAAAGEEDAEALEWRGIKGPELEATAGRSSM